MVSPRKKQYAVNRPSIVDRYKLHQKVVDQNKANDGLQQQLAKEELLFEKMCNRVKESEKNLAQIELDDQAMRRDLACFDNCFDEAIDVQGKCAEMMATIKQRSDRLVQMSDHTEETKFAFVDEVIGTVGELFRLQNERAARNAKVVGIVADAATLDAVEYDYDAMPPEMWINQNRIKQRREAFYNYFIREDEQETCPDDR